MITTEALRTCTKCSATYPETTEFFRISSRFKSGWHPQCADCRAAYQRAWYEKNREKKLAQNREWKEANRDTYHEQQRQYMMDRRKSNPEMFKAMWRDYRVRNREKLRQRDRDRYAKNPVKERERRRLWGQRNPDKLRRAERRRSIIGRPDKAIQDGQSSPICRMHGFSLVRLPNPAAMGVKSARFRAARLDKPLEAGERAIVQFRFMADKWVCLMPSIRSKSDIDILLADRVLARYRAKKTGGNYVKF